MSNTTEEDDPWLTERQKEFAENTRKDRERFERAENDAKESAAAAERRFQQSVPRSGR